MNDQIDKEEQTAILIAAAHLFQGDLSFLIEFLERGRPISARGAAMLSSILIDDGSGEYQLTLVKRRTRGRPKSKYTAERMLKCLYYADYLVRHGIGKSDAAREAAGKFNTDHDQVRRKFKLFSELMVFVRDTTPYAAAIAEAENNPD